MTVNDYLARRDSEWVGQVHRFLGLKVGLVQQGLSEEERKAAYRADITYVTNSELGFDYLRDNLAQVWPLLNWHVRCNIILFCLCPYYKATVITHMVSNIGSRQVAIQFNFFLWVGDNRNAWVVLSRGRRIWCYETSITALLMRWTPS